MRIDTTKITVWNIASKTRPIQAKPLACIITDRTIADKFLIDTLEGKEPLGEGVVICVGEAGDTWQQTPEKLLKKYSIKSIDKNGWMWCEPLPDNAVYCIEATSEMIGGAQGSEFSIVGQWGATVNGEKNIQKGVAGDFICQNQTNPTDIWIVKRKLFLNTYVIKS